MADEQTGEEVTAPPPSSEPATAAEPAPADPPAPEPQAHADEDAEVDQYFANRDADLNPLEPAAKTEVAPPASEAAPAAAWSEEESKLLSRWKLKPGDLEYLQPEHRKALLGSLGERASFVDRFASQVQQAIQQQNPPAAAAAPAAPPAEDPWKDLRQEYGDQFVDQFRGPMDQVLAQRDQQIALLQQQNQATAARVEQMWVENAWEKLTLPDGVDKSSADVRAQVEAKAYELLKERFVPGQYDWRHAIPEAAAALFNVQAIQAERARKAAAATQSRRGSAHSGVRRPAAQMTPPDPDAEEDRLIAAKLAEYGVK